MIIYSAIRLQIKSVAEEVSVAPYIPGMNAEVLRRWGIKKACRLSPDILETDPETINVQGSYF